MRNEYWCAEVDAGASYHKTKMHYILARDNGELDIFKPGLVEQANQSTFRLPTNRYVQNLYAIM